MDELSKRLISSTGALGNVDISSTGALGNVDISSTGALGNIDISSTGALGNIDISSTGALGNVDVMLKSFPYPPYLNDIFLFILTTQFPFIIMLSFIVIAPTICKDIVLEKEKKLKVRCGA